MKFPIIESIEEMDAALDRNEAVIRRGLVDVGLAFKEIVKLKLYKEKGYKTFPDYCRGEWDLSYEYVKKIMKAAEII